MNDKWMTSPRYRAGFLWAQDQLRRGLLTEDQIDALTDANGIDPTEFDEGARDAMREFAV